MKRVPVYGLLVRRDEAEPVAEEEHADEEEHAEEEEMAEEEPMEEASERVQIRWWCCLGTGDDPSQIEVQEEVAADFNASQDRIELVFEVVTHEAGRDALSVQIASGDGPMNSRPALLHARAKSGFSDRKPYPG